MRNGSVRGLQHERRSAGRNCSPYWSVIFGRGYFEQSQHGLQRIIKVTSPDYFSQLHGGGRLAHTSHLHPAIQGPSSHFASACLSLCPFLPHRYSWFWFFPRSHSSIKPKCLTHPSQSLTFRPWVSGEVKKSHDLEFSIPLWLHSLFIGTSSTFKKKNYSEPLWLLGFELESTISFLLRRNSFSQKGACLEFSGS